jgi:hypothetical protein
MANSKTADAIDSQASFLHEILEILELDTTSHGFVVHHNTGKVLKRFKRRVTVVSDWSYIYGEKIDNFEKVEEPGIKVSEDSL